MIEKTNPLKGMVDEFFYDFGMPAPDEFWPSPAAAMRGVGLPTPHEAIPTPKEVGDRAFLSLRSGMKSGRGPQFPIPPPPPPPWEPSKAKTTAKGKGKGRGGGKKK